MKPIKIITATDENYCQHLGVMLQSLIQNNLSKNKLEIYIIDGGISKLNKDKLSSLENDIIKIYFLALDENLYNGFPISHHINKMTYCRISISNILDESIEKILYLDCDLLVLDNIMNLWNIDIQDYCLAAVGNPLIKQRPELQMPLKSLYFNGGIMLINLKKWRDNDISEKVFNFINNNIDKIVLWDQDALNAVLYNQWLPLHPKWNVQTDFFKIEYRDTSFDKNEFMAALAKPAIIHFSTSSKPWQYINNHPYKARYWQYLKETPWANFKYTDKTLKSMIVKFLDRYFPRQFVLALQNISIKLKGQFYY